MPKMSKLPKMPKIVDFDHFILKKRVQKIPVHISRDQALYDRIH